jgi:flagellar protein FlbD
MIRLTRLNGQALAVNCDLIKFVEQTHDTVLTLINNDKVVVRESLDEVVVLVEDDASLRSVLRDLLKFTGHTVVECCDAEQALTLADRQAGLVTTMIIDYATPGLNCLGSRNATDHTVGRYSCKRSKKSTAIARSCRSEQLMCIPQIQL